MYCVQPELTLHAVSSQCEASDGIIKLHSKSLTLLLKVGTVQCVSFLLQVAGPQPFVEESVAAATALSRGTPHLSQLDTL